MNYALTIVNSVAGQASAIYATLIGGVAASPINVTIRYSVTLQGTPTSGTLGTATIAIGQSVGQINWTPTASAQYSISSTNDSSLTDPLNQAVTPSPAPLGVHMQTLSTTILGPLTLAQTNNIQITLAPPQKPNGDMTFVIDSETFIATGLTGDGPYTLVGVTRGVQGTTAAAHNAGTATMTWNTEQLDEAETAITGSTSGTATFSEPESGTAIKIVVVYLAALLGTATYTFATPFRFAPTAVGSKSATATSISTTAVTITGSTDTGYCILMGK